MSREHHERNRRSWNAATRAHNSHKVNQADFLRDGGRTLFPEEIELLGEIRGRRLAHLQCNSGQDSLSLASLGAEVTGIDISDEAIAFAHRLSAESGIPCRFVRADVYDWLHEAADRGDAYDVIFCSYGALPWLSSIEAWARGVARVLVPRGVLVMVEFHPVMMMFDEDWNLRYPYSSDGQAVEEPAGVGDYVSTSGEGLAPSGFRSGVEGFENPEPSSEFYWGVGQVLEAITGAGLRLECLREYPYANGCRVGKEMRELSGRRYLPPEGVPSIPMMYGVVARRPASE